tara:strand:- start:7479 stop:7634 length:156 start_codon:yes stop_codon:yes gene_type:complete
MADKLINQESADREIIDSQILIRVIDGYPVIESRAKSPAPRESNPIERAQR